jgi:hypothetical protein
MNQFTEIRFNVEKSERKALATAVADIAGCELVYKGVPSFAFVIGNYTIDRYGTLSFDVSADSPDVQRLLAELTAQGFIGEGIEDLLIPSPSAESSELETTEEFAFGKLKSIVDACGLNLTIEVPFVGFTTTALENLDRLVTGKAQLIMKAIGAEDLSIERTAEMLRFSWFPMISSHLEVDAYARLVYALCEMARKQKRVTLKEKPINEGDSERFVFRCFLLRLGFIGQEYASARKVLLSKLSGSSAFKNGNNERQLQN